MINLGAMPTPLPTQRVAHHCRRSHLTAHDFAGAVGVNPEALRYWVRQDENGRRPSGELVSGSVSEKDARISELERELAEARRANEILRLASASFAREIDLRPPR
jgi:transposase